jgi:hypothetical protein
MKSEPKVEWIILLLFIAIVFFTLAVFMAEVFFQSDGQLFQLLANILSGFVGALMMRVKPRDLAPSNGNGPAIPPAALETPVAPKL